MIAQNDILVQRLLDLERLTAMRCDCSKLRAEVCGLDTIILLHSSNHNHSTITQLTKVSDKNSQLKEARNQVAEMTKRLSQAQNQMNTMQQQQMHYNGVPMCIRCGQNEVGLGKGCCQ